MEKRKPSIECPPIAFLLAQLGSHAAMKFAERLASLHLTPPDAGILRVLSRSSGLSQQELAAALRMHASRLVAVVDELEKRGLVQRLENANDRRTYALHLTEKGREILARIGHIGHEHNEAITASLDEQERLVLAGLLQRIANEQRLAPGIHPGYSRLGRKPGSSSIRVD